MVTFVLLTIIQGYLLTIWPGVNGVCWFKAFPAIQVIPGSQVTPATVGIALPDIQVIPD